MRGLVSQEKSPWKIDEAIGEDTSHTDVHRMCVSSQPACHAPRDASTTLVLLEHGSYAGKPASKVLLIPHTGKED